MKMLRSLATSLVAVSLAACPKPAFQTMTPPDPAGGGGGGGGGAVATRPADPPPVAPVVSTKAKKIRTVEGIDEYRLDNGMQILLFPDQSQSTVTVNITYLVGSKHEGAGETGMAHLLEHMLFKGTPTNKNVLKILDERGAFSNGTTWTDRTNYYETLPAVRDNMEWAIGMEADRMLNATISPQDLSTEFSVVRNEMEIGENNPDSILEQKMAATAYIWHNYGKDTIGARSDVEKVPADKLRVFYEKYYQPDNAVLVVSGKFDRDKAIAQIEKTFGAIPRPRRALPPHYTVEPVQDGERHVVLRRTGDVHVVAAMYHTVGGAHPDFAATQAAQDALIREPSGRIYKALVEPGIVTRLDGWTYQFKDPTLALFRARLRDGKQTTALPKMLDLIERSLIKNPITAEEVERWRSATLKDWHLAMSDSGRIAIEISEWAALGDWRLIFAYRDRVKATTVDDVNRVAKQFFKQSNRTSGEFIPTEKPDRAPLPDAADVPAIASKIDGGGSFPVGEQFDASIDNLMKRIEQKKLGGGISAALLPKKTRGGKVQVRLVLHVGDENSLKGKVRVSSLVGRLAERGTKTKTYQQVEDAKNKLMANVDIESGSTDITATIETTRENLPATIDLVADMMKNPRFDAKELEVVRRAAISQLEANRKEPQQLAFIELYRKLNKWPKGDVREVLTIDERIAATKAVTRAQVAQFHKEFWGAGRGELVAIGDFDPAALTKKIDEHFGSWTTKRPYKRLEDKIFDVPGGEFMIDTKDKEMMVIAGAHPFKMKDDHPDYPALLVASYCLGGGLGSRIWMRLRENEGISYGAWAGFDAAAQDEVGQFYTGATLAPSNLSRAKTALKEEIDKVFTAGVTDAEVATGKKAWNEQLDNILSDDGALMWTLSSDLDNGRDLGREKSLKERVTKVTPADVNRVYKTYLDPKKIVFVVAGDKDKIDKTDNQKPPAKQ
jgi:zinc protease